MVKQAGEKTLKPATFMRRGKHRENWNSWSDEEHHNRTVGLSANISKAIVIRWAHQLCSGAGLSSTQLDRQLLHYMRQVYGQHRKLTVHPSHQGEGGWQGVPTGGDQNDNPCVQKYGELTGPGLVSDMAGWPARNTCLKIYFMEHFPTNLAFYIL